MRKLGLMLVVGAAVAVAGCGSSSSSGSSSTSAGASASGGPGTAISAAKSPDLGTTVLVDSKGDVVYMFEKDESDESYCKGACAGVWPPVTTSGNPQANGGVDASKLGTLKRDDGSTQVTYAGHPLYTYAKDSKPGQAAGNEVDSFGAEWYALETSGAKAESKGGKS